MTFIFADLAFIAGQVQILPDGRISPVIGKNEIDLLEFTNFAVSSFILDQNLDLSSVPAGGGRYSLAAKYNASTDEIFIMVVSTFTKTNFICEEREFLTMLLCHINSFNLTNTSCRD